MILLSKNAVKSLLSDMGTSQKDVTIKPDAPDTLLLEKHVDYILHPVSQIKIVSIVWVSENE